ncbi:MAG: acyl dehydratase [Acidimicrobiales bacterium]
MRVGDQLAELELPIDSVHVFMFSAVTWNRHLIHYDQDQARTEGHTSVVAQRALIGNYFARQLDGWLGERGELRRLDWKVVSGAVPGDVLTCTGDVVAVDGALVTFGQRLHNQDSVQVASATAVAEIEPQGAPDGSIDRN